MDIPRFDTLNRRGAAVGALAAGFSLIEIIAAAAIVGIICAIAIPSYSAYVQRTLVVTATIDIMKMSTAIGRFQTINNIPPPDLAAIGFDTLMDPWGRPYAYLSFTGLNGKGQMRKDKHLNPLNTEYDLYSVGADGQTRLPLTVPVSKDDVILANDGNYIGLASKY